MWVDYYDMTDVQRKEHDGAFGGFNDLPPNWSEATERRLVEHRIFDQSPVAVQFRQMRVGADRPLLSAHLFFFADGSGYARAVDHEAKRLRWFTFTRCVHQDAVVRSGRTFTDYRCTRCGHERTVDSSD
jgi:hypothetical protein